jgi:tetratricopeptide (TPR) repeat protein
MKRPPSSPLAVATGVGSWRRILPVIAFVFLGAALTVRPILGEMETIQTTQLISPSPLWWNTSPAVMYISHVLAAVGLLLAVLWAALQPRPWRFTGLEPAVALLFLAAVFSVPAASDKRLAINVAIGTILPIAVAAVLVQVLADRPLWRRALLGALVAAAIANCWRATRQHAWENKETWEYYLQHKAEYWTRMGKSLDDPMIPILEARIKADQPSGYFYHPNVLASFLLLGIAAATAGVAGLARRHGRGNSEDGTSRAPGRGAERRASGAKGGPASLRSALPVGPQAKGREAVDGTRAPRSSSRPFWWAAVCLLALVGAIVWQLIIIKWVGSVGARAGISLGVVAGLTVWFLRRRPRAAALICLGMLASVQISLVVLAARADALVPALAQRGGKLKSMAFRLDYWHGAMELFARHPITGVGPGQFGEAYPAVKPIRAAEEVAHAHDWLLNVTAEWGILGLLGTLAALVLPAWLMLRPPPAADPGQTGLARDKIAVDDVTRPNSQALALTWAIVFVCWLVFLPGVLPAGSAVFQVETLPAVPLALVGAALASIQAATSLVGRVALFAGLAGFFVHATVEMASGVPGAMWPFWATAALALSWADGPAPSGPAAHAGGPAMRRSALVGTAAIAVMVLVLSYNPIRSIWAMSQAKNAFQSARAVHAEGPLLAAAEADGLDPAPRAALSEFYRRMAQANPDRAAAYLRQAVLYAQAAVNLDPANHTRWYDLAFTTMDLARVTKNATLAQQAVGAMRRAVQLYPNWPRGHLRLARLLAGAGEAPDVHQEFLEESRAEFDQALRLDEQWPADDPNRFDAKELADVRARRERVVEELGKAAGSQPAGEMPPETSDG